MQMVCVSCGKPFQAKRQQAKFCGPTCRKRAQRAGGLRVVQDRAQSGSRAATVLVTAGMSLVPAVEAELGSVGMGGSAVGQAALVLARAVDDAGTPPSAKAALVKELLATLAQAIAEGAREESPMDRLMGRVGDKLRTAGA